MRLIAIFSTFVMIVPLLSLAQVEDLGQLEAKLAAATHDTTRIATLSKMSRHFPHHTSTLSWARKAYQLSVKQPDPIYKGKAEEALGMALRKTKPDSAKRLQLLAIERYESAGATFNRIDAIRTYGRIHEDIGDLDSAYLFFDTALQEAKNYNYHRGIGDAYYAMGRVDNQRGNNVKALQNSKLARDHYKQAGLSREMGDALNQMGIIYDIMGMYPEALENYLQAKEIAEDIKDTESQIIIANNLGVIYDDMKNPQQALAYYQESMELTGIYSSNPEDRALLLNNISYVHMSSGDTTKAIQSLWESISIVQENKINCFEAYPMEGLVDIYIRQRKLDSARHYLARSLKVAEDCNDVAVLATLYRDQGRLESLNGNVKRAAAALEKSLDLSRSGHFILETQESLYELFKVYKAQGDQGNALHFLEKYQQFKDSINTSKSSERAAQLAAEYDFRKQVEQMDHERKEAEIKFATEMAAQKREYTIILIALILLGLFSVVLGRFYILIQGQNKKLKWLNEEKNTLMGVVAHDLRNPLNMIKGLMGLIEDTRENIKAEDLNHYLMLIGSTTDRMSGMIDRVLDISAIESMKLNLNLSKTDLTKSLARASENFSQIANQKKINIENHFDKGHHHFAMVDSHYLDQVLDNLISNAIKFSDRGKRIYLDISSEGGQKVISIKDEGPGISEEDQDRMFKKFTRLGAQPTGNEKSTGLGLSIVKKFVTAMGGEIECNSQVNEGTTFSLRFKSA